MKLAPLIALLAVAAMLPPVPPRPKAKRKPPTTETKGATLLLTMTKASLVAPPKWTTNDVRWRLPANASNYWWNLETSTNLKTWSLLRSNVSQTNTASWTVTNNKVEPKRFYRLSGRLTP